MPRKTPLLPIPIRHVLGLLGADLHRARRRRRLTTAMVAERAQISRPTLLRVERGDPAVSLGVYATVLWVLGLGDRLGRLAAFQKLILLVLASKMSDCRSACRLVGHERNAEAQRRQTKIPPPWRSMMPTR